MNPKELLKYDGKNGHKAYIAYKGKIYDVTDSKKWLNGIHMGKHKAGEDLTDFLSMAPHADEVLKSFDVVGTLEHKGNPQANTKEALIAFYQKFHPHPILLHYPLGLFSLPPFAKRFFCLHPYIVFMTALSMRF